MGGSTQKILGKGTIFSLFKRYLLSIYYGPGTVLGTGGKTVKQIQFSGFNFQPIISKPLV